MTTNPQKIKARLSNIAADVRDVYQDAACCINALQEENRELQAERDELVVQLAEMLEVQADHVGGSTPTPAPVTAETIRQSEPGSTWVTPGGSVFEWTGSLLVPHTEDGGLHSAGTPDPDSIGGWPLTRSTAAPRGDYGKAELPTEHSVQIDPAVYETMFSDQEFLARLRDEIRTAKVVTDE